MYVEILSLVSDFYLGFSYSTLALDKERERERDVENGERKEKGVMAENLA